MALGTGVSVAIEVVSVATAVEVLCEFVLFVAALPIAAKMIIAPKTIPRMSQGFVFFFGVSVVAVVAAIAGVDSTCLVALGTVVVAIAVDTGYSFVVAVVASLHNLDSSVVVA